MNKQHTDLTFFTNGPNQTLLDRFKATLSDTHLFDVLVGYFRASGFYQLYDSIEPVEKTRILVGLGIDDESNRAIHAYRSQTVLDFESHKNAKDQFQQTLIEEIEQSEEADDKLELGLKKFIAFLKTECADSANDRNQGGNGRKLEIRAFPSRNIHAKVYIGRFAPDDRDYGFVVTGSSNFSYSGLVANREFNVELRQRRGVEYALEQFEDLWRQSVDISEDFVDAVQKKTWLNDSIGEKLRRFFLSKVEIKQLIDFGDSPIFSEATTYTNILLFEKGKQVNPPVAWDLSSAYRKATSLERMLDENPEGAALFSEEGFVIASAEMAAIKKRIEQVGTPLKEWDIAINYGIKTGFNEAFIIDGQKKDELIAADPKSAEIIKPILRGRDIKRYRVDFADLWLITTFPALNLNIDHYPAVRDYLKSFGRKLHQTGEVIGKDENGTVLKSRKKTGNKWFETQDQISYFKEFSKEKIVWLEMSPKPNFAYSVNEDFVLNTSYILSGKHLKWLLAILNSEIMDCYFPMVATDVRGKTRRYIKQYVELLPILPRRESYTGFLEPLVDYAELAKSQDYKLQSAYFEQLIDGLVYELYFPDELKAAGKDILRHLGELTSITDSMSNENKLAIIQREFDRLYDPRHPVRNSIETLDSVEVVRTIRAALKR